ncbi:MAG: restriction endonuclease [Halobacteriaceae archaeon]
MPTPDDLRPLEWRSYEKLVAGISVDIDDVEVEHRYDLELETGGTKEVDVMIWDRRGEETETIMVECRYYDSNLAQDNVDSMVGLLSQSNVDRAIIITKTGFQSGAIERAEGLRDNSDYNVYA